MKILENYDLKRTILFLQGNIIKDKIKILNKNLLNIYKKMAYF